MAGTRNRASHMRTNVFQTPGMIIVGRTNAKGVEPCQGVELKELNMDQVNISATSAVSPLQAPK